MRVYKNNGCRMFHRRSLESAAVSTNAFVCANAISIARSLNYTFKQKVIWLGVQVFSMSAHKNSRGSTGLGQRWKALENEPPETSRCMYYSLHAVTNKVARRPKKFSNLQLVRSSHEYGAWPDQLVRGTIFKSKRDLFLYLFRLITCTCILCRLVINGHHR